VTLAQEAKSQPGWLSYLMECVTIRSEASLLGTCKDRSLWSRLRLLKDPDIQVPTHLSLIGSAIGQFRDQREWAEHHWKSLEEHFPEDIFRS
jgi:hypothetical protein